jgi:ABC-type transport system involved in cytochrome c biogenesis permease subunit
MNSTVSFINVILPILYIATFGVYSFDFWRGEKRFTHSKRLLLFLTLMLHIVYLIVRTLLFDHPPITNVFEIFTILAFSISFSYFILELVTDIRGTGPFIIIISIIFQIVSTFFINEVSTIKDVLRSNLLGLHVFSALVGYSGITMSAVYGFLYLTLYKDIKLNRFGLIFNRLPNLEVLETLSYYSAVIGFVMLTFAIVIGIIWVPVAFPNFRFTDPKLVGTFMVWLLYGFGILSKTFGKWRGKKVVLFSIIGFVIAILSTTITNFLSSSFHSFF